MYPGRWKGPFPSRLAEFDTNKNTIWWKLWHLNDNRFQSLSVCVFPDQPVRVIMGVRVFVYAESSCEVSVCKSACLGTHFFVFLSRCCCFCYLQSCFPLTNVVRIAVKANNVFSKTYPRFWNAMTYIACLDASFYFILHKHFSCSGILF